VFEITVHRRLLVLVTVAGLLAAACISAPVASPPPAPAPAPPLPPPLPPLPAAVPTAAPTARPAPPASNLDYGIHMFVWGQPATTQRDLRMAVDGGFRWQKTLFQWREIEGAAKGQFDWTESDRVVRASAAAGVRIIARIDFQPTWARADGAHNGPPDDFQDYWDFVSEFVGRYRAGSPIGQVHALQVWNEPNLEREWGNEPINADSAADYVRLLRGAHRAAHAADPGIIVLSAGLSPTGVTNEQSADDLEYLRWMYRAGLRGAFDALGVNANAQAPEVAAGFGALKDFPHPSFYFRRVEQLRAEMVDNGDGAKQIWLLEWGWTADAVHPNYAWFAVSETKKAENIVEAFTYARTRWAPWIGVMVLWTLPDPTWDRNREEYWWAIADPDGTPRPAYARVKEARRGGLLP
jgi:polysaccharide biosynthesis protein PslG